MMGKLKACAALVLVFAVSSCQRPPRPAVAPAQVPASSLSRLQHDIDATLAAPELAHTSWGVLVRSLSRAETLYGLNPNKLLMPASNMKIVTLAAAAERLGWDYTYETRLLGVGAIGSGTLDGDLLVVGSGDPSITSYDGSSAELFGRWAEQLKTAGVRAINGRIIGDDHTFDDDRIGFGWSWDDLVDDYAAGVGALQFNENSVQATIAPGAALGAPALVTIAPDGSGLALHNLVKTIAASGTASIQARRLPGSTRLELRGSVPLEGAPIVRMLSVDSPTMFFLAALRDALIGHGIDVRGPAVDIDEVSRPPSREDGVALVTYRSAPLSTLAVRLMKVSQNLYAETFLKTIGAAAGTPTIATGVAAVGSILKTWGLGEGSLIQRDGSGLSRYDYVTPEALVAILTHVDRDGRLREPFESSLPVAGRDGTLQSRMKGTPAEGNARAKTGSMSNVRALSGYVQTADGEPLVFSIVANNFDVPGATITQAEDAIVVRLAQFSRR